jgi:hypothetical protein
MAYCVVNKQPVFLYSSRYQQIQALAMKGKDATQKMASIVAGTKESQEQTDFAYEFLLKEYEKDPVNFHINWAAFDINGNEAVHNVWDVLNDYCNYYKCGYLTDLRDYAQHLMDGDASDTHKYPVGQVFSLNHSAKSTKWWWPYTHGMKGRTVSLLIVAKNVYRLAGDLTNFTVFSKDSRITCGSNLGIYPLLPGKNPQL